MMMMKTETNHLQVKAPLCNGKLSCKSMGTWNIINAHLQIEQKVINQQAELIKFKINRPLKCYKTINRLESTFLEVWNLNTSELIGTYFAANI